MTYRPKETIKGPQFEPREAFQRNVRYELLPFRSTRIPGVPGKVLVTTCVGEYLLINEADFQRLIDLRLDTDTELYRALRTRHIVCDAGHSPFLSGVAAQQQTRKQYLREDPGLHIVVTTLRCDHRCHYCQISPRREDEVGFDMTEVTANAVVDRIFESRAPCLTIEFQGGESGLAFDRVRSIVTESRSRERTPSQALRFVLTSTLHRLSDDDLIFCRDHGIELSTSLDGPDFIHDGNRINATRDSYRQTIESIKRARAICGPDSVAALATITRYSLAYAKEIIDTYVELGFDSISLRPVSPLGFAARGIHKLGFTTDEYLAFYEEGLDYLIKLNLAGVAIDESYATLLLTKILTPFATTYVDLQSPCAAGTGVLAYNYDGSVYVSDEARMLAAMGDERFRMGSVHQTLDQLQGSPAMDIVRSTGVAENLPVCKECAFVPYCGADPIYHVATQGDPVGHRSSSEFCHRHTGLFELFFERLSRHDADIQRVFLAWMGRGKATEIEHAGYVT